jgi:type II secretory pathway pseudopilin PulG
MKKVGMHARRHDESGDTLLELVIALVLIGLVVGAFFATYTTQGSGSTAHRTLVTADGVLRAYAEAAKSAVRDQCAASGATQFSVTPPTVPGYTLNALNNQSCPPRATSSTWPPLMLTVTMPNGQNRSLSIVVRSP